MQHDHTARTYRVLICDPVGLLPGADGTGDCSQVRGHIEALGCFFHEGPCAGASDCEAGGIHFFYQPALSTQEELLLETSDGRYDAVIAAATVIPPKAVFSQGGVRIGAGTGNMQSLSWGGGSGQGGDAPLMNTPGINSRATAQMVMKAILRVLPDLPFDELHTQCVDGRFDTGRDLHRFPTEKLEGKRIAILGYGNIGREVARLAAAFGMRPVIYARQRHRGWIESEGFQYAATPREAAEGADVMSVHLGLGVFNDEIGRFANSGIVDDAIFSQLRPGAVLINFDRGELVDTAALGRALGDRRLRFAAIDADIFHDAVTQATSGPLAPYLALARQYAKQVLLLPHAVADTDHPSRVAGATQAVDQIVAAIRSRQVGNVKGDVPPGYVAVPGRIVPGISGVTSGLLAAVAARPVTLSALVAESGRMHAFWSALAAAADADERERLCLERGGEMMMSNNLYAAMGREIGLLGPFVDTVKD